ncbi:MAG: SusD/RagB family nutrient-binding outer membrane lipoprotein, partial [Flavobacteriales bacterium]
EMISEQYWAATLLNEYESFSNWRRTGYPTLVPTSDPGSDTGGPIPRRLIWPEGEASTNAENFAAAIARQGPNNMVTRVWWDK